MSDALTTNQPVSNSNPLLAVLMQYLASMQASPSVQQQQGISNLLDAANQARQNYAATPGTTAASMAYQRQAENDMLAKILGPGNYGALHRDPYGNVSPYDVMGQLQQKEQADTAFQRAQANWLKQHANMAGTSMPESMAPKWLIQDPNMPSYMQQRSLDWRLAHPQPADLTGPGGAITPQELANYKHYLPHGAGGGIPGNGPASSVGGLA